MSVILFPVVISSTWNNLVTPRESNSPDEKCLPGSEMLFLSDCTCLCVFYCLLCSSLCYKWKWRQIKSMDITTPANLECNYTVAVIRTVAQKQIRQALLPMKWDWLIDLCMSSEGQRHRQKDTTECESGSDWVGGGGGGCLGSIDEAWTPDGGRRVLNQTETNGVWETERKNFRHTPADLNPFSPN